MRSEMCDLGFILKNFANIQVLSNLKNRQSILIACLWVTLIISYLFAPYGNDPAKGLSGEYVAVTLDPNYLIESYHKIIIFY